MKTLKQWSIELGFNGKLNKDLEDKIQSVKKVRKKFRINAICSMVLIGISFYGFYVSSIIEDVLIKYGVLFLAFLSFFLQLIYLWGWFKLEKEIIQVKKERFREYELSN